VSLLNNFCSRKKMFTYFECRYLALCNHQSKRMHYITLSCVPCLYHIFPQYFIKDRFFRNEVIEHKMRFLFCLQILSERLLFLKRIRRVPNCTLCKANVILVRLKKKEFYSKSFVKFSNNVSIWYSVQWESKYSMLTEGWNDSHHEANNKISQIRKYGW
jgi:hypothetical protein